MGPLRAVRAGVRRYASMRGRASRSEFWWFTAFNYLVGALALVADATIWGIRPVAGPFEVATVLLFLLPQFAVCVRRLHDTGKPVWSILWPLPLLALGIALGAAFGPTFGQPAATLAGLVVMLAFLLPLFWLVQRSDARSNRYGPNPSEVTP